MIVSWNWLKDYVSLDMPPEELEERLMMAGLNHEGTQRVGDDLAIDLEVTSNRPDCLGHLGVAREAAVLYDRQLQKPSAAVSESGPPVDRLAKVRIDCPDLCYRYSARVIRGVEVGPSPKWLADRLATIGIGTINNIVDITNYVLMECGQPLHAFDYSKLAGGEILVREAAQGESLVAIDHRTYVLEAGMCVIADSQRPVALAGVMGGEETEVSEATTDLLVESAQFAPLSVRNTARKLNLHSPSSYRFERGVDPEGVDWASRRCCQLVLDLAGGELAEGVAEVGREIPPRSPIVLRLSQLKRILGIEVSGDEVRRILAALGNHELEADADRVEMVPPSWRRDLTREIDLVEEVARIHGYDQIPEDVPVPMWPSHRSDQERVLDKVRTALIASGFDEAMMPSVVPQEWAIAFSPWTDREPIVSSMPMKGILADAPRDLGQADRIRRTVVPSLLESRRYNESVGNETIELFEIAKVYLPDGDKLPHEQWTLGITSGGDYFSLKGVLEGLAALLNRHARLDVRPFGHQLLDASKSCELWLDQQQWGFLGEVTEAGLRMFGLRSPAVVAELRLDRLKEIAVLIPTYEPLSPFPTTARDLNLIVDEPLRWSELAATVREAAGQWLQRLEYQDTYRDPEKDGPGKKRLHFSFTLRAGDRTLTSEEADQIRDGVVNACRERHRAQLLG